MDTEEISEDEYEAAFSQNSVEIISKSRGRTKPLLSLLRDREICQRRAVPIAVRAKVAFPDCRLIVRSSFQRAILTRELFKGGYNGFMGITLNSHYLLTLRILRGLGYLYFFAFSPAESTLERILTLETPNGYLYHVKGIVPPLGDAFFGAYSHDETEYRRLTIRENNLSVNIHLSPMKYPLQVNLTSLVVVIPRIIVNTPNRKSLKHYVVSHPTGIMLITGVSILNFMFTAKEDTATEGDLTRNIWKISRKNCYSWDEATKNSSITLELGENLGISACPEYLMEGTPYKYTLHSPDHNITPGDDVLPILFCRDSFAVDSWLIRSVEQYLRKTAQFRGCAIRSLYDYEVDVRDMLGSRAYLQAFALLELEVYVDQASNTTANEFHLFRIITQWNLVKGAVINTSEPLYLGKVEHRNAFANRWWPLKLPGAVATMDFHRHCSNIHILAGKGQTALVTCDDHLVVPLQGES